MESASLAELVGKEFNLDPPSQGTLLSLYRRIQSIAANYDPEDGVQKGTYQGEGSPVRLDVNFFPVQEVRDERNNKLLATVAVVAEDMGDEDGDPAVRVHELWWQDVDYEPVFEIRGSLSYYTEEDVQKTLKLLGC